jgi:hypothetical protein
VFSYPSLSHLACLWPSLSSVSRLQARFFTFQNLSRLQVQKLSFKHLNIFVIQDLKISNLSRAPCPRHRQGIYRPRNSCVSSPLRFGLPAGFGMLTCHIVSRLLLDLLQDICAVKLYSGVRDCHSVRQQPFFLSLPSITMCRRLQLVLPTDIP